MKNNNKYQKIILYYILSLIILMGCKPKDYKDPESLSIKEDKKILIYSPDKKGRIELVLADLSQLLPFFPQGEHLYYKLFYNDKVLIEYSPLGIEYEKHDFFSNLSITGKRENSGIESYILAHGKKSEVKQAYNETIVHFTNKTGKILEISFRLQNDGAAFQYRIPQQDAITASGKITKEYSGFRIPSGSEGWMQEYQEASKVSPAYEYYFTKVRAGEKDSGKASIRSIFQPIVEFTGLVIFGSDGWAFPALFEVQKNEFLLITEAGLTGQYAGTHLGVDPDSGLYTIDFPSIKEGQGIGESIPLVQLPFRSTWRVMGFGDLKKIIESTLVQDLSEPLHPSFNGKIPDWIKVGKSTWDWWSYLETGNLERQKKYADAASEFGWEYVLVDANWNKWNSGNPDDQIKELVKYASEKNVSVILWYNSGGPTNKVTEEPRDRIHDKEARRKEFAKLKEWGVKGIKIDFWQSDKQSTIQTYLDVLKDAAEFNITINFHGATIPRGWERQYPNLMTMEAVKGAEWYRFPVFPGPKGRDNVYYSYTRNVIGPMDYTPIVFEAAYDQAKIGYAHSLALSVIFESAVQHYADNSDSDETGYRKVFGKYPFVKDFLKIVPASWDETIYLEGHPDSHIVLARRRGKDWFLGAISASNKEIELNLNLSFLGDKNYKGKMITEIEKGNVLQESEKELKSSDEWKIRLLPFGGLAGYFKINE